MKRSGYKLVAAKTEPDWDPAVRLGPAVACVPWLWYDDCGWNERLRGFGPFALFDKSDAAAEFVKRLPDCVLRLFSCEYEPARDVLYVPGREPLALWIDLCGEKLGVTFSELPRGTIRANRFRLLEEFHLPVPRLR